MNLREELLPLSIPAAELEEIERKIDEIERRLENEEKEQEAVDRAIESFNARYGRTWEAQEFRDYSGSMSRSEFALRAAQPPARRIADITHEELIEIVRRIQEPERAFAAQEANRTPSERHADHHGDRLAALQSFYLELLEAQVAMPEVSDLIFWDDLEPEEIVDRALAYRPIALPPE